MRTGVVSVLPLWDVILVPLQGDVGDREAEQMTEDLLALVAERGPAGVVVDLSAVALVDSHLCASIASLAAAVSLMGAKSVVCGVSPEIAMTLETMGVTFRGVTTTRSVEEALSRFGIGKAPDPDDDLDAEILADIVESHA